jgi:hypothetical protein
MTTDRKDEKAIPIEQTPVSINEPPGSDVLVGIPEPGKSSEAKSPTQPPTHQVKTTHSHSGDPDELEDEIDQAEAEGDVEQRKSRGVPPKTGRR